MDVSRLDEMPPGRQPVETRVLSLERLAEVVDALARHIARGGQAYWVCPLVEESEASDQAAAEERARVLRLRFGDKVGLVHGRMKGPEKDEVMAAFQQGALSVLVATTVIEVGVDVPNATLMIVEGADRFGLAQLHQLRGRVGRGEARSICLLLRGNALSETGRARLALMRETNDGFRIAEEDLRLRGAGEILGTRQSGEAQFRLASPEQIPALAQIASDDARLLVDRDGGLEGRAGQAARVLLYLMERDAAVGLLRGGLASTPRSRSSCCRGSASPRARAQQPVLLLAGRDADRRHRDRPILVDRLAVDFARRPARSAAAPRSSRRTRPSPTSASTSAISPSTFSVGSASPDAPSSNVLRAVSAASRAASSPCAIAVAASASTFFASLISAPSSASSRAISSSGRSVNRRRNRPTSPSCGVPPELPVIVGAELVGVEPDRACRGLAHLAAVGGGDQRRGQAVELGAVDPAGELDAVDDIAPLVRAAELQPAAGAPRQLEEVVGLEDHVVEFEEGQRLLALEPEPDAVEGQHPVDREMRADVAQEGDVVERVEPVGIVDHDRVGRAVAEGQEALEDAADRGDVGVDRLGA